MPLYERLLGWRDDGTRVPADEHNQIPVHQFTAVLAEFGRGRLDGPQAQAVIASVSRGVPLTPSEVTEAQTLLATITGSGTAKLARAKEIDDVLILGARSAEGYKLPSQVKARLGV